MTPADALSWLIGLSAIVALFGNLRYRGFRALGWVLIFSAILGLDVAGAMLDRPSLVYVSAGAWVLFVIVPSIARRRVQEHLEAWRFDEAIRWARVAAWLHPFDDFFAHVTYLRALGAAMRGRHEEARGLLTELEGAPGMTAPLGSSEVRELARIERKRLDRDYRGIVERVNAAGGPGLKASYVTPYLRALGEMGEVSRLLETYARLSPPLRHLRAVRLIVLAFAGRPDLLRLLFERPIALDPTPAKTYWLAVAEQAAGDLANASKRLEGLRDGEFLREQVNQRLVTPAPRVDPANLTEKARIALAELEQDIVDTRVLRPEGPPRRAIATYALMGVLVVVFVVESALGKDDTDQLISVDALTRLGALVLPPELTGGGAGWRVIAAGFLHVNETHLAMNLLGLWVLGPLVERTSGRLATLVVFVASSVGAFTTALFFMHADLQHRAVALGASAGLMGLVGAIAGFSAIGFLFRRSRLFGRQLGGIAAIVAIQLIFDAYHPGVSSFLHLAGAGWGAVVALPYALYVFRGSGKGTRG